MPYTVGHNMPGYLPESDPYTFADYESAKRSLIDEVQRDLDDQHANMLSLSDAAHIIADERDRLHDYAEELSAACEDLNLTSVTDEAGGEYGVIVGNVSYWIIWTDWSDIDFNDEEYGDPESLALAYLTSCSGSDGKHWYGGIEYRRAECPTCHGTDDAGHLACPGSRYGSTSADCASIALRAAQIYQEINGDPITTDSLDGLMSLVVNDSDGIAELLAEYGTDEEQAEWSEPTECPECGVIGENALCPICGTDEAESADDVAALDEIAGLVHDSRAWYSEHDETGHKP